MHPPDLHPADDAHLKQPLTKYAFRRVERCDMCGSRRFKVLGLRLNRSQGLDPRRATGIAVSVLQCIDCGLIFAAPQPIPEELADHYGLPPEEYWTDFGWSPTYFAREIATAKRLLSFRPGMTALDIGAGQGKAMRSLIDAGFDTWGIEPSVPFRDLAVHNGIDPERVVLATIEDFDVAERFDFITFGAVLEHLFSPSLALQRAMSWLKPNGIIQAEVPSADYLLSKFINLYFRLRGTNYVTHISPMHPPFHLYEFTLESFQNFDVAEHYYDVGEIPHLPRFVHPPLRWWMERTHSGMQLTVYLRNSVPARDRGPDPATPAGADGGDPVPTTATH